VRAIGIDLGERRVGVAISDATGTLARPLVAIDRRALGADLVDHLVALIADVERDDEPIGVIVVGLPRRLDGTPTSQTPRVEEFVERLRTRCRVPVVTQDERLTSREAESRLALRLRDWRERKKRLDAAAAAIILQDYLDSR
jgi:putative Holliday junction resolvase